jgi:inner membrane protein
VASLGHVAVGFAASRAHLGRRSLWAMLAYAALSLLPDADVLAFVFHVPYSAPFGHRGATHSFAFAALVGGLALLLTRRWRPALVVGLTVLSHPLLDALTDGGLGVALFWPMTNARYFAPWSPLPVAPLGLRLLSPRGLHVVLVEAAVFLPVWVYAFWRAPARRRSQRSAS